MTQITNMSLARIFDLSISDFISFHPIGMNVSILGWGRYLMVLMTNMMDFSYNY